MNSRAPALSPPASSRQHLLQRLPVVLLPTLFEMRLLVAWESCVIENNTCRHLWSAMNLHGTISATTGLIQHRVGVTRRTRLAVFRVR